MKSILLVRVSTLSQDYEAQKEDLISYSKQLGCSEYHIIENKESGIKLSEEERIGLNSMKDWLKTHPDYDTVIVWEISRLARSEKVLHSIKEYFLQNHIQLYIYDKQYKLLNEDGSENQETSLLFSLYAYFAASEVKIRKERFTRSKKLNSQLGKFNGGPAIKYGYMLDENNYIVPDPVTSERVKKIFQLYSTGKYSTRGVSEELNALGYNITHGLVNKILRSTAYIGYSYEKHSKRKFIPIISEDLFKKVQEILIQNTYGISRTKRYYLALKLIKCPVCGGNFLHDAGVYNCYRNVYLKECSNNLHIDSKHVDMIVWYVSYIQHSKFLNSNIEEQKERIFQNIKTLHKKAIHIQNQINHIKLRIDRVNTLFINMKINEKQYKSMESKINDEVKEKESLLKQIDSETDNNEILLMNLCDSKNKKILSDDITMKEMRDIVVEYINKIYPYKEKRNNKVCDRLEVFYKKVNDDGGFSFTSDVFYFYPFSKKEKIEFNGKFIDDEIIKVCGKKSIDVISEYKR